MQITQLTKQKSKKAMYSVYVDNNFVCSLDEYTIYRYHLTEGADIDKHTLETMQADSMTDSAFGLCVDLLSKGLKTEKQIRDYLRKKGYLGKVINNVVQKLEEYKYINDEYYAESYISQKSNAWGKYKLKNELRLKGIAEDIIDRQLDNIDNQDNAINTLAQKYIKNKEINRDNLAKLSRHLASKGFGWDEITKVIDNIKSGANFDEDW